MTIPSRFYPIIIIGLSLTVRTIYFFQFQNNPFFDFVPHAWDQDIFDKGAKEFAHGNLLAKDPNQSDVFSPLYRYFLGVIYWLFGESYRAVWSIQFLIGTGTVLLVYKTSNFYFKPTISLLAALLFSLYGPNWLYEGSLYRASLTTFLTVASCCGLLCVSRNPSTFNISISATLLSLVMQCRSNNLFLVPIGFIFLWMSIPRSNKNKNRLIGIYTVIFILFSTPLLYRGYLVHDHIVFYDQGGPETLLMSNLPDYPGRGYTHSPMFYSFVNKHSLTTLPVIKFVLQTALENPQSFLELYLRKLFFLLNNYEAPTTFNYYLFQKISPILLWGAIPFAFFGALGISGLIILKKKLKRWTLLHAYFFVHLLMFLPFYAASRFRLPLIPFLAIFSAFAIHWLWKKVTRKDWTSILLLITCSSILAFSMTTFPTPEGKVRVEDFFQLGKAYLKNERIFNLNKIERVAIELWDAEVNIDPTHLKGSLLLSTVYNIQTINLLKNEDLERAAESINISFQTNPFHSHPFKSLSLIFKKIGNREKAINALIISSLLEPNEKKVYQSLTKLFDQININHPIKISLITQWFNKERSQEKFTALKEEFDRLNIIIIKKWKELESEKTTARDHFLNHRWEKAVQTYSQVNKWNAVDASLYLELGISQGKLGQTQNAVNALYSGLLIDPKNPYIHRILSDYYLKVENSPYMSAIHLRHYLENAKKGTSEYKNKEAVFKQFHIQFMTQKKQPHLPLLSAEQNRQAFQQYNQTSTSPKN